MQGRYPAGAYPIRYAVTIEGAGGIYEDWNEREFSENSFDGQGIVIKFAHPIKVRLFIIKIIEPRPNTYWGVDEIRVREIRLFGRFWRTNIKNPSDIAFNDKPT